ncbi:MAG: hypothetical protein M3O15_00705 [Acidobacteriota bacterium]|nr:hypothetical protein [Acidobacteriota bacterium]
MSGPEQSADHVAKVARRALQQAAGGRPIPEELVRAVAQGTGDRSTLASRSRGLFDSLVKPLDLILFDTDRIAAYVFESSRPPILTAGSKILRDLNQGIADDFADEIIFSGGGEGLLLVPSGHGTEICDQIRQRYALKTGGTLGVTADFLAVAPEDFLPGPGPSESPHEGVRLVSGTQAVLSRLRDRIRDRKNSRLPDRAAVPGTGPRCVSCRDRQAGSMRSPRKDLDGQSEGGLCTPCGLRLEVGREVIDGYSFQDLVDNFKATLGDRAHGARSQYLGFLYADGNSMGNLFGRLPSLVDLRFASLAIARVFARTSERLREDVASQLPPRKALLSLLGGGDEAIWILPGALAVRAAEQLDSWIGEAAAEIPGLSSLLAKIASPRLTFGAGLVLCDLAFPVRYQYELANALLKNAKSMFRGEPGTEIVSSIDFAVLTDSSPLSEDLDAARKLAWKTAEPDFLRTCRPYTCAGFSDLLATARRANEAHLGKSQLYALQTGAAEGRRVFLNHLRYQMARPPAGKGYQKWIGLTTFADPEGVERFFLRRLPAQGAATHGTWIPDLLELKPFLDLLEAGEDT